MWKGLLKVDNHGSKTVALSHTPVRFNRLINQRRWMDPYAYARSPFWKETLRCARLKRPQNLAMHLSFPPMPFSSWLSSPCIVCRPLSFLYRCDASTRPDPTAHLIMCVGDRAEIRVCVDGRWMVCLFLSWRLLLKCNMQAGIHASHRCTSG